MNRRAFMLKGKVAPGQAMQLTLSGQLLRRTPQERAAVFPALRDRDPWEGHRPVAVAVFSNR